MKKEKIKADISVTTPRGVFNFADYDVFIEDDGEETMILRLEEKHKMASKFIITFTKTK